jgi:biotin carboxyl carrier protein
LKVDVEAGGRRRTVSVERCGDEWMVTVDGRPLPAAVSEVGDRWSLLLGAEARGSAARRSHEVSFGSEAGGGIVVFVDGVPVRIEITDPRARGRRGSRASVAAAAAPRAIASPMPGRVVKVLVERGQVVAARQPVVVVEAMKMENELRAPRAGTVAAVHVTEGMSVDAHAVLMVLE